jgi:hypothetical protein
MKMAGFQKGLRSREICVQTLIGNFNCFTMGERFGGKAAPFRG